MTPKEKHKNFLRISGKRTARVLEDLEILSFCSNPANYLYDNQELEPIFSSIEEKLRETRTRLEAKCPYRHAPFTLSGQPFAATGREEVQQDV